MKNLLRSTLTTAAALLAAGTVNAALVSTAVVNVGDMQAAQWTQQVLRDTGNATLSLSAPAAGGNGGSFWLQDFSRPLGPEASSDVVANLFMGAVWDPATQGAVENLRFVFDARGLLSSGISSAVSGFVRPVIEQSGVVYSVLGTSTRIDQGSLWLTIDQLFDDAAAWGDINSSSTPDFSAAGAPIHFGYRFELGLSCGSASCSAAQTQLGIDNFRVSVGSERIAQVDEPAPWALLALSLPLAAGLRHRARRAAGSERSNAAAPG